MDRYAQIEGRVGPYKYVEYTSVYRVYTCQPIRELRPKLEHTHTSTSSWLDATSVVLDNLNHGAGIPGI